MKNGDRVEWAMVAGFLFVVALVGVGGAVWFWGIL